MPVELTIGRKATQDIQVNDKLAEDLHAVLELNQTGEIWVRDLETRYGTLVNNRPVQHCRLQHGDLLQIGFTRIDWEKHIPDPASVQEEKKQEIAKPDEARESPSELGPQPVEQVQLDESITPVPHQLAPPAMPARKLPEANKKVEPNFFEQIIFNPFTLLLFILITMWLGGWLIASANH